jgi:hypothetical protein
MTSRARRGRPVRRPLSSAIHGPFLCEIDDLREGLVDMGIDGLDLRV